MRKVAFYFLNIAFKSSITAALTEKTLITITHLKSLVKFKQLIFVTK